MKKQSNIRALQDEYRVPGFRTRTRVDSCEHNPAAFIITLVRRQKKQYAMVVERVVAAFMIDGGIALATSLVAVAKFISTSRCAAYAARCAA
jgi:hypothetical protein